MLDDEELADLAADIRDNGQREPVLLYDGRILDGRNRWRACQIADVPCRTEDAAVASDEEALALVVSLNVHRRHLTESQRAMVAARMLPIYEAQAKERQREGGRHKVPANLPEPAGAREARAHAARSVNVSSRSVQTAKRVLQSADPAVVAAVDSGRLAVSGAASLVKQPADTQRRAVDMVTRGKAKNARAALAALERERRVQTAPKATPQSVRLDVGDAVEWLEDLDVAPACVVTDPPYGLDTHRTREGGQDYADGSAYAASLLSSAAHLWVEKCQPGAHVYVFSGYSYVWDFMHILRTAGLWVQENPLVWVKDNHTMCDFSAKYPNRYEFVIFAKVPGGERKLAACVPDVLTYSRDRGVGHSAAKPVALLRRLIEQSTAPGEVVCDPFAGSGSTAVACVAEGRAFVGCEISEDNAALARSRLA